MKLLGRAQPPSLARNAHPPIENPKFVFHKSSRLLKAPLNKSHELKTEFVLIIFTGFVGGGAHIGPNELVLHLYSEVVVHVCEQFSQTYQTDVGTATEKT